jgi:C1A family cysteine protease
MQRPVRVSRRTRDRRRKRSRPSLPIGPLAVRWRLLRLEPLEDRTLLDAFGTGLVEPSEEDLAWAESNLTIVESVSLNSLARQRLREEQHQANLVGPVAAAAPSAISLGSEVVGRTAAEIEAEQGDSALTTASLVSTQTLPTAVDNSTLPYFPPIRSQGSLNSCAAFAPTYYTMTYMTAMARGWDVRNDADNTNKFSPKWPYNFTCDGDNSGSSLYQTYQILATSGCATWAEFPYDTNYREWVYDDPAVWRKAIQYRTDETGRVDGLGTGAGLENLKSMLADGYILNFGTYFESWQGLWISNDPSTSADDAYVGETCGYWVNGTRGSHEMTVVGYNDNIWADINGNGSVDIGEKGAFRIANSWGTGWGDAGFIWMAYDGLRTTSAVAGGPSLNRQPAWQNGEATWFTVKASYTPALLAEFTIQHAERDQLKVSLGLSDSGNVPTTTWEPFALSNQGGPFGFDGRSYSSDPLVAPAGTFVVDWTDLNPPIGALERYFVGLNDTDDPALSGTISVFQLTDAAGNVLATCPAGTEPGNVPQTDIDGLGTFTYAHLTTSASPLVVDSIQVSVPEGTTATFRVRLAQEPSGQVTVAAEWASGDATVSLADGSLLVFDQQNWNAYQTVVLSATEDADRLNGLATINLSSSAFGTMVTVTALVLDNDHCVYYVNDAKATDDEWCTAPGADTNDGLSPATPKATVQSVLDAYALGGGDVVRIDTGYYPLTSNIQVGPDDSGDANQSVTFEASPYGVTIDRAETSFGSYGWEITGSHIDITTANSTKYPWLSQSFLKVTNASTGFLISGSNVTLSRCESVHAFRSGFSITGVSTTNVTIRNALAQGSSGCGVYVDSASQVRLENCTIIGSASGSRYCGIYLWLPNNFSMTNSIVVVDGASDAKVWQSAGNSWYSDYNDFWVTNGAVIATTPAAGGLGEWRSRTGLDVHSLSVNPLFVDSAEEDYHLQSVAGSYHGGTWTADPNTSCCIDAGYGTEGSESEPNVTLGRGLWEGRRNLGAYGGTEQASKTPDGSVIWVISPAAGQITRGSTQKVAWGWTGVGIRPGETIRLEYSDDTGTNWHPIPGADSIPLEVGTFEWDVSGQASGARYLVRIVANNASSATGRSGLFQIRAGHAVTYYVNDGSIDHDTWCTAPGSSTNDGLTPGAPKLGLDDVLVTYDIEPGDQILVDTGSYNPNYALSMETFDVGDAAARVTVSASPYGVVISALYGASWRTGDYVTITTAACQRYPDAPQSLMKLRGLGISVCGDHVQVAGCDISGVLGSGVLSRSAKVF